MKELLLPISFLATIFIVLVYVQLRIFKMYNLKSRGEFVRMIKEK